jgi:hypothetical protein
MKKTIVTSDGYTFFIDGAGRAWIANEESSVCDEANAIHGIKNPDELSGWIESIINEMAEDYQAGDWVAKYVGEEI